MKAEIQKDKPAGHCQPLLLFAAVKDRTKEQRTGGEDETRPYSITNYLDSSLDG